jgi:hypothetical protein
MGKNKGNLNLPPITLTKYRFGMIATTLHLGKRGEKTVQIKKTDFEFKIYSSSIDSKNLEF